MPWLYASALPLFREAEPISAPTVQGNRKQALERKGSRYAPCLSLLSSHIRAEEQRVITLILAVVLWSAIGGRLGLKYAQEDARRKVTGCVGYGMLFGALFGALLGWLWLFIASLASMPA